jgi:hypothetical protein
VRIVGSDKPLPTNMLANEWRKSWMRKSARPALRQMAAHDFLISASGLPPRDGKKSGRGNSPKQIERGRGEWDTMDLRLFRRRGRLYPRASVEIELLPPCTEDFVLSGTGQEERSQGIGRLRVPMRVQGRKQGREFGGGKIALAFFFVIAFDSLSRIVSAHLLANRQGQHFRQERDEAIGAVRGAFAHFSMQVGNVGMTFKLPGFRFQGLISQRHKGALREQMLTFEDPMGRWIATGALAE